ncbi:small ribosomal subunit protein eS19-like [Passer domesticus]|uniref:small ribosomal subunit protein eS19-like n=1 Tax=Passer domesticus TaxID=48849 RepID=UPI0030FE0B3C
MPPVLAPGRLQPPPGHGTGTQVLGPGLWGHLCHSAVHQASLETLLCVAKFLKRKDLDKVVKKKKLWMFADTLNQFYTRASSTARHLSLCSRTGVGSMPKVPWSREPCGVRPGHSSHGSGTGARRVLQVIEAPKAVEKHQDESQKMTPQRQRNLHLIAAQVATGTNNH